MPARFDLIVFDWDGTLMDSAACIAGSLQAACGDLGYPVPTDRDARYVIGLGLHDAMAHVLPGVAPAQYEPVVERYRHHFLARDSGTTLFAGVVAMVRDLHERGHLLAVATGKTRRGLDRALEASGLAHYFHATRCADEGHSKPHPGMLQWLMAALKIEPERTLMIGDTTHDMGMARTAGVPRLAIAHGAHDASDLVPYEPLAILENCGELRAWLARNA
ncbi:MAG: haloacid dehalogenase superfamily enzyme subfamily [Betaproteobacteria bacterium]|nr:haloacid dehalogenase superfamily enzyme subfamily [Betaproteobacteria bacterium]